MFQSSSTARAEGSYAPATGAALRNDTAAGSASHSYFAKKGELNDVKKQVRALRERPSAGTEELAELMKKALGLMTAGIDLSSVFDDVVALSHTDSLLAKKLLYRFITSYAETNAESAVMCVNTFLKDCKNRDAQVRGLALRSLCGLRTPDAADYAQGAVLELLGDRDAYVRKVAVLGALRLSRQSPEFFERNGLADRLYNLVKDPSRAVAAAAINALEEVSAGEGGMAVNHRMMVYLLNRLGDFGPAEQQTVLGLLRRFEPQSEEELFNTLGLLDDLLRRGGSALAAAVVAVLAELAAQRPQLLQTVAERAAGAFVRTVVSGGDEEAFVALSYAQLFCAAGLAEAFRPHLKFFYVRAAEKSYNQRLKVQVLQQLICVENAAEVLEELAEYTYEGRGVLAQEALKAMGALGARFPSFAADVAKRLQVHLRAARPGLLPAILFAFAALLPKLPAAPEELGRAVEATTDEPVQPEVFEALLEVLCAVGPRLARAAYVFEKLVDWALDADGPPDASRQLPALLNCSVYLFLLSPGEFYPQLTRVLNCVLARESDVDLHERGCFYYNALASDPQGLLDSMSAAESPEATRRASLPADDLASLFQLRPEVFVKPSAACPRPSAPEAREQPREPTPPAEEIDFFDAPVERPVISLSADFYLSDEEFQAKWLDFSVEFNKKARRVPGRGERATGRGSGAAAQRAEAARHGQRRRRAAVQVLSLRQERGAARSGRAADRLRRRGGDLDLEGCGPGADRLLHGLPRLLSRLHLKALICPRRRQCIKDEKRRVV